MEQRRITYIHVRIDHSGIDDTPLSYEDVVSDLVDNNIMLVYQTEMNQK